MDYNIIFIHGWGMDSDIWRDIAKHFSDNTNFDSLTEKNWKRATASRTGSVKPEGRLNEDSYSKNRNRYNNCILLDLGFIGARKQILPPDNNQKSIYITHSLGTLWALKHHANNMAGLVAINGFSNFTDFADRKVLRLMQIGLKRDKNEQMHAFWKNCGFNTELDKSLNIDNLHTGLDWLANWNESKTLAQLKVPILSLCGDKDRILPYNKVKEQWSGFDLQTKAGGDHILPISHSKWCVEKIRGFISEFKVEKECH